MSMIRNQVLAVAVSIGLPLTLFSYTWPAKPVDALTADLSAFVSSEARTNDAVRGEFEALAKMLEGASGLAWMEPCFRTGEALLARSEGGELSDPVRRAGLFLLDYPVHVDNIGSNGCTAAERGVFESTMCAELAKARRRVIDEARAAKVPEGSLRIWRIYNMGFVLKGPRHTVLIDITYLPPYSNIPASDYADLADLADVLFVTHPHQDHCTFGLFRAMEERQKPVVVPCARLKCATGRVFADDSLAPREVAGVQVRNFLGDQGPNIPCNVYHLTIDGVTVVHNGDNYDRKKEAMLAKCPPADAIIGSTWNGIRLLVGHAAEAPGFDRNHAVVIPAHENEITHTVCHRESYCELYTDGARFGDREYPWPRIRPIHWGESLTVTR